MNKVYADAVIKHQAIDHFESFESGLDSAANEPVHLLRKAAIEALGQTDFPSIKDEEWKYTNIKKLVSNSYAFAKEASLEAALVEEGLIPELDANYLVFVNGIFNADLSKVEQQQGVVVANLKDAYGEHKATIDSHLGQYAVCEGQPFTALNTAFVQDGAFIHVSRSKVVDKPVYLLYFVDAREEDVLSQPRSLVVVEENAQLTLIENNVKLGEHTALSNQVSEIVVAPNAVMDHYKLQNEEHSASQVCTTQVEQADRSNYSNTVITTKGGLIRNNLNIGLGEHCESFMNGLYFLDGSSHVDNHTMVDHRKPNSYSNELYKGLLDGKSTGVFNGKIFVREGAQKTNAFQSNKNILMSGNATVDTKPQLEIWADDVSCSHGCTVGALDEEPLFYLRARGIPEHKARGLLMFAFAGDVLEKIKLPALKQYIEQVVADRLHYELD